MGSCAGQGARERHDMGQNAGCCVWRRIRSLRETEARICWVCREERKGRRVGQLGSDERGLCHSARHERKKVSKQDVRGTSFAWIPSDWMQPLARTKHTRTERRPGGSLGVLPGCGTAPGSWLGAGCLGCPGSVALGCLADGGTGVRNADVLVTWRQAQAKGTHSFASLSRYGEGNDSSLEFVLHCQQQIGASMCVRARGRECKSSCRSRRPKHALCGVCSETGPASGLHVSLSASSARHGVVDNDDDGSFAQDGTVCMARKERTELFEQWTSRARRAGREKLEQTIALRVLHGRSALELELVGLLEGQAGDCPPGLGGSSRGGAP